MQPFLNLSNAESEIMQYLWAQKQPVTLQDVITYCTQEKGHTWKQQTIYTFLSRLEQKGIVTADKRGQKRYYSAAMTLEELTSVSAHQFLDSNFKGSLKTFLTAFTGGKEMDEKDKADLREFLEN